MLSSISSSYCGSIENTQQLSDPDPCHLVPLHLQVNQLCIESAHYSLSYASLSLVLSCVVSCRVVESSRVMSCLLVLSCLVLSCLLSSCLGLWSWFMLFGLFSLVLVFALCSELNYFKPPSPQVSLLLDQQHSW
jgi:hypothetical protein